MIVTNLLFACNVNLMFSRSLLDELPKVKLHNELVQTSVILLARTLTLFTALLPPLVKLNLRTSLQNIVLLTNIIVLYFSDIKEHVKHIEKSVSTKEPRFMSRALRALVTLRKKLNQNVLRTAIQGYFPNVSIPKDGLLDFLEEVTSSNVLKGLNGYSTPVYLQTFFRNVCKFSPAQMRGTQQHILYFRTPGIFW